jgi:hypothetical protein
VIQASSEADEGLEGEATGIITPMGGAWHCAHSNARITGPVHHRQYVIVLNLKYSIVRG